MKIVNVPDACRTNVRQQTGSRLRNSFLRREPRRSRRRERWIILLCFAVDLDQIFAQRWRCGTHRAKHATDHHDARKTRGQAFHIVGPMGATKRITIKIGSAPAWRH